MVMRWPEQGDLLRKRVAVWLGEGDAFGATATVIHGTVVRADVEDPNETIVRLDDSRFVRGEECILRRLTPEEEELESRTGRTAGDLVRELLREPPEAPLSIRLQPS